MKNNLEKICKLIRYYILLMTTKAQSGHATSSLSAVELMASLFFNQLHFDLDNPENPNNDKIIFSKGHASPLFYSLFAICGKLAEKDLLSYRSFSSNLEGHPSARFSFTEVPTGSLGQGLSIGVGEALAFRAQISNIKYQISNYPKVYVLLGDGEMSEGSVWEAIQYAAFKKLNNLIAILDVNRFGQSEETMFGHDIEEYAKKISAFGWNVIKVEDGHNLDEINEAFIKAIRLQTSDFRDKPTMIIAKTIKGKGFSLWEDKNGWHSKPLSQDQFNLAQKEIGEVDKSIVAKIQKPALSVISIAPKQGRNPHVVSVSSGDPSTSHRFARDDIRYAKDVKIATKKAFGDAIEKLGEAVENLVVLDGDVKNSLHTDQFANKFPDRFFQCYIAEQNMVGMATGIARRGFLPFVTTFSAFMSRAHDQIRMAGQSGLTILFNGSYAGVSIGKDGSSQMGLEDIGLFRSILNSIVLYPSDAVSTEKLVAEMLETNGIVYVRTTREPTPVIYASDEEFKIGGSKIFRTQNAELNHQKKFTIVAAGITLHEALKAQKQMEAENIAVDVIDCYSIKPIDRETLIKHATVSKAIIIVEDHYQEGGLGDAVLEALAQISHPPIYKMAVSKMPRSGKPKELLEYEGIDQKAIINKVKEINEKA